jgi:hypothetical protein
VAQQPEGVDCEDGSVTNPTTTAGRFHTALVAIVREIRAYRLAGYGWGKLSK